MLSSDARSQRHAVGRGGGGRPKDMTATRKTSAVTHTTHAYLNAQGRLRDLLANRRRPDPAPVCATTVEARRPTDHPISQSAASVGTISTRASRLIRSLNPRRIKKRQWSRSGRTLLFRRHVGCRWTTWFSSNSRSQICSEKSFVNTLLTHGNRKRILVKTERLLVWRVVRCMAVRPGVWK